MACSHPVQLFVSRCDLYLGDRDDSIALSGVMINMIDRDRARQLADGLNNKQYGLTTQPTTFDYTLSGAVIATHVEPSLSF